MSAIVLNRELTYKGRRYAITPIRRQVVRVDENGAIPDEHIDTNGFRREHNFQTSDTWDAESLMQTGDGGGLIVGEGDTGKTWFTEQLEQADDGDAVHVSVIKLRGYLNDASKLIDVADRFWSTRGDGTSCANLVFDGLDENPNAGPVIIRICHGLPDETKCRVWVTSRMCGSVREILASGALKQRYGLLPLSEDEIESLAENVHEDGAAFLAAIKQRRVAMFAAKPGGATNLLSLYGDGKILTASRQDLIRGIALKFVHESRDGVEKSANELRFDDDKLLDASAWIATRLLFARKNRIWNSGETSCPPDALHYDELLSAQNYPRDLMNVATGSRLFEPLDDYSLRFTCDETLMPFLAAHWICTHVPKENIPNLIKTDNGVGKTVATVFNWLGLLDPLVVQQWIKVHPVAFLGCREAVEFFGVDKYYRLLESQLIAMSPRDCSQAFRDNADRLHGEEALSEVAHARLTAKKASHRQATLAAELLNFTRVKTDASIDLIAAYLARHWEGLSVESRNDFAFALENLVADDKRHYAALAKLRPLLFSLQSTSASEDDLLGVLLELLWPRYLSAQELVSVLTHTPFENRFRPYREFLEVTLPESFEANFDASNIDVLLDWTLKTGIDAEVVLPFAKKWAEMPAVAEKLRAIRAKIDLRRGWRKPGGTNDVPNFLKDSPEAEHTDKADENARQKSKIVAEAELQALVTAFSQKGFVPYIVECTRQDGDAVKHWLDTVMGRTHRYVSEGFDRADLSSVAQFYLWMEKAYPPEKGPPYDLQRRPIIIGEPIVIDEIYVLKSRLAGRLLTQPTKEALEVFDAALAKEKNDRLADMRKRMAHVMEELLPPELASADVLTKIAALERPIGQMTVKEYNKLVKELNKDLATKTDLNETFGKRIEDIKKQLLIVKEITLGGLERLKKRSQQKQKRVNAVIDKYYELITNGTKKREALTDACNEIEKSMGLAGFKLSGLRNAADRAIKKCERKYGDEAPVRYREEIPLPE